MAGRPKKPAAVKELEGNPGHRPIQEEPQFQAVKIPKCPTHLKGEARKEWKRVSQELFEAGLLANVDRAALAAYCTVWARWVRAEKELDEGKNKKLDEEVDTTRTGLVLETDKGYRYQNPWVSIANKSMEDMKKFMAEFGMTPASRGKVSATKKADPAEMAYQNWVVKAQR